MHGERHQAHAALGVEALHGLHQADVAFLDEVCVGQAVAQVLARHRHHQAQMGKNQLAGGAQVFLVAQAAAKFRFTFRGQDRQAVDRGNISVDRAESARIGNGQRQGVAGSGQRGTGLLHSGDLRMAKG
ncbi:hypothetical protein D3C72_1651960 [compost metagenome]